MADGMTKALAVVRRVAKQAPKIVVQSLPLISLGASGLTAYTEAGGDVEKTLKLLSLSFIPVNIDTGEWQTARLRRGLVPLIASVVISKVVSSFL